MNPNKTTIIGASNVTNNEKKLYGFPGDQYRNFHLQLKTSRRASHSAALLGYVRRPLLLGTPTSPGRHYPPLRPRGDKWQVVFNLGETARGRLFSGNSSLVLKTNDSRWRVWKVVGLRLIVDLDLIKQCVMQK